MSRKKNKLYNGLSKKEYILELKQKQASLVNTYNYNIHKPKNIKYEIMQDIVKVEKELYHLERC